MHIFSHFSTQRHLLHIQAYVDEEINRNSLFSCGWKAVRERKKKEKIF